MGYSGRLELTWTNKGQRLWSSDDGKYQWVDRKDPRVTEVRALEGIETVGEVDAEVPNLLISGDSLQALTALNRIPELAQRYSGQVRLVYIDPPFNTGQAFAHYDDNLEHSVWLSMFRDRLIQLKPLLAPDGSIWVHLDDAEVHRCRVVMDEVLGVGKFVASVVWQKRYSRDNRPAIGPVHDTLLVYSPAGGQGWKHHRNRVERTEAKQYRNPNNDPRGDWRPIPMTAQGFRPNQMYEIVAPGGAVHVPPKGRCWSMVRERFDELLAADRIYFGQDGNSQPNVIRYLDEDEGLVPWSWWPASEVGHNDEAKKEILTLFPDHEAFGTPKPERLMERIIHIATNPGDIVLDCFAGSGTTAAVAHKMGRRWVTVEREHSTVETFTAPRLKKVVAGEDPGGITSVESPVTDLLPDGVSPGEARAAASVLNAALKAGVLSDVAAAVLSAEDRKDQDLLSGASTKVIRAAIKALRAIDKTGTETRWHGGGGFEIKRIGPSMFDIDDDSGLVFMSDHATNGRFATACAAHLGFQVQPSGPFVGRKGNVRLAALDGVVGTAEIDHLVRSLDEGERMVVVAKAFTDDAQQHLKSLSKGSRLRHAPTDLVGGRLP